MTAWRFARALLVAIACTHAVGCDFRGSSHSDEETTRGGEYHFAKDWFSQHIPVWSTVLSGYRGAPGIRYLEVGTYEGRSFFWMLDNVVTHPTSRAVGVDLFPEEVRARFDANLAVSGHGDRVSVIAGPSQRVLRELPVESFDLIYLDGSHAARDVLVDAVNSWSLLRNGGVMILDDYTWRLEWPLEFRPRVAIDAFLTVFRNDLEVVIREDQVILRKVELSGPYILRLGDHAFFWRQRVLVRIGERGSRTVSDEEASILEQLALSRGFGQTDFDLAPPSASGAELERLLPEIQLGLRAPGSPIQP